eukprot:TRINITY_DN80843_c0_g1_i1.p1 TRINITY_DN80843_c0_g1~~TRINITY_DN80843_c0_g1_i1.p1  ORF type:complete len:350 (+),score=58.22 TRINITY_DN80843_c0_g1_i1:58-1107(+)
MPGTRHSKSNQIREFFTYAERDKWAGIGTHKARLGADSMRSFDSCCLCLQFAKNPVATPGGYLYCKECLYENILSQKQSYQRLLRAYEEQQLRLQGKEEGLRQVEEALPTEIFIEQHEAILPAKADEQKRREELKRTALDKVRAEGTEAPVQQSFWIPQHTPSYKESILPKPENKITDPMDPNGAPLKLKKVVECNFSEQRELQESRSRLGEGGTKSNISEGKYKCPSCCRTLTNATRTCVLSGCGHVICDQCVSKFLVLDKDGDDPEGEEPAAKRSKKDDAKTYKCIVCAQDCPKKEIIRMRLSGTGFAAGLDDPAKQVASVYTPGLGYVNHRDFHNCATNAKQRLHV